MSAQFCLGRSKFSRIIWAARQHGGTPKIKVNPTPVSDLIGHPGHCLIFLCPPTIFGLGQPIPLTIKTGHSRPRPLKIARIAKGRRHHVACLRRRKVGRTKRTNTGLTTIRKICTRSLTEIVPNTMHPITHLDCVITKKTTV